MERPTQFEAPFFRFAAQDPAHELRAFFTNPNAGQPVEDAELGRAVDWGFDLLAGYPHEMVPAGAGSRWWRPRLLGSALDLLVVNGYTQPPYVRAALAGRGLVRRVGLRIDTVLFDRRPSVARRVFVARVLARVFDRFLATGSLTRRYLEACGIPAARIGLFPYAIDVTSFREGARLDDAGRRAVRQRFGIPADARLVLAVTKLSPREAPWDLLRAGALRLDPRVFYLIVGDGPLRAQLERYVALGALGDVVRFAGYVPYAELPRFYGASDIFVHAPCEERWGVSVAEAMAAGLPVVACSRVGAAHDLIALGSSGFVYEAGRDRELAAGIGQALALDPDAAAAAAARRLAEWDYAAAWRHLLESAA